MPKIIPEKQIFDAAISVFLARGYERATTKEISEVAGMNETTLFRKYNSKAELLKQALLDYARSMPLDQIQYTGNLQEDLVSITKVYLRNNQSYGDLIPVLLSEAPRYPELQEVLEAPLSVMQAVGEVLVRYQREGLLRPEPVLVTIGALVGPFIVNRLIRRAGPVIVVPEIDAHAHVAWFLQGRQVRSGHGAMGPGQSDDQRKA
ncbi:MAG: TetR/AcrR family transcriptional regulator [Bacillota bacterium]